MTRIRYAMTPNRCIKTLSCSLWALSLWLFACVSSQANTLSSTPAGGESFSYAWLKGQARHLAEKAYQQPTTTLPAEINGLSWDDYQQLRFNKEKALWSKQDLAFRTEFFHLGLFFKSPVKMAEVVDGKVNPIAYDSESFSYGETGIHGEQLPADLGFAGFRMQFDGDWQRDVVAFLGASYFRAVGEEMQYGISARGLAVDTALPRAEEFPMFTHFWLERPAKGDEHTVVYALLDSPSITGAYRIEMAPGEPFTMRVDSALYPRQSIERLGIAPLTSMYMVGENDRRMAYDWRPEIHDSDGLAMWTGAGEWIWRPLNNPRQLRFNAYADHSPRGFGLLQRDRNFDHYQDDGVFYERRPSVWVEPLADWGKGSVQLVEIPTLDETFDNIVAFWNPAEPVKAGDELLYSYNLYWGSRSAKQPKLAQVVDTFTGLGGVIGKKREYYSQRFAVDFSGGELANLDEKAKVEAVISHSSGKIEITSARPLHSVDGYRAMFDVVPDEADPQPINLRLYLAVDGKPLTETWMYQWTPPPKEAQKLYNPGE